MNTTANPRSSRYNLCVRTLFLTCLSALFLLVGCARAPESKDAVRQAVIDYLATRDDMMASSMDVDVVSVDFRGKEAEAVVSIGPKGNAASGIKINYTLDAEGQKWIVRKKAPGESPAAAPHGETKGGELPAGHPPVDKAPHP